MTTSHCDTLAVHVYQLYGHTTKSMVFYAWVWMAAERASQTGCLLFNIKVKDEMSMALTGEFSVNSLFRGSFTHAFWHCVFMLRFCILLT
jgi:hypothetical protein